MTPTYLVCHPSSLRFPVNTHLPFSFHLRLILTRFPISFAETWKQKTIHRIRPIAICWTMNTTQRHFCRPFRKRWPLGYRNCRNHFRCRIFWTLGKWPSARHVHQTIGTVRLRPQVFCLAYEQITRRESYTYYTILFMYPHVSCNVCSHFQYISIKVNPKPGTQHREGKDVLFHFINSSILFKNNSITSSHGPRNMRVFS